MPSISLLTNTVPDDSTETDVCEIFTITLSELSPAILPISLIDFLGTIPLVLSEDASLRVVEASANLCASVATVVIFLSSMDTNSPLR